MKKWIPTISSESRGFMPTGVWIDGEWVRC